MILLALMAFDLQGHRGARGLAPENTLAGFRRALELGVDTLELDVGLTSDGVLVVAHDPEIPGDLARRGGAWLDEPVSVFDSTFAELRQLDVGRLRPGTAYTERWPEQQAVDGERIPALAEVFALSPTVRFNVEAKVDPTRPEATASPEAFANALVAASDEAGAGDRVTVQSFDWRVVAAIDGRLPTACLTMDKTIDPVWLAGLDPTGFETVPDLVAAMGCGTWSPHHRQVSAESVARAHELGLRVVPWTVNTPERAAELIAMGVDGLITDYPDRVVSP